MKKKYLELLCILVFVLSVNAFTIDIGSISKANIVLQYLNNNNYKDTEILFKEEPALIYTPNENGLTPLALATQKNDLKMFQWLLDKNAPISHPFYEKPLIILAIYNDSRQVFVKLLELGVDSQMMYESISLLHLTVLLDKPEMLKILLQYGADTEQLDNNGLTPFHMAAIKKNWNIVEILSSKTKNVNSVDKSKLTPLSYFITTAPKQLDDFLAAAKDSVPYMLNYQTKTINSPLSYAINTRDTNIAKNLLERGVKINLKDLVYKRTPLIQAVLTDNESMVKILLSYEPDIYLKDKYRKTALDYAKEDSSIKKLLESYIEEQKSK